MFKILALIGFTATVLAVKNTDSHDSRDILMELSALIQPVDLGSRSLEWESLEELLSSLEEMAEENGIGFEEFKMSLDEAESSTVSTTTEEK